MSELVLATADICLHGTSSTLCEWCNYKSRIPHLESQLRDAVELLKTYREALELHKSIWHGCLNGCLCECKYICEALSTPVPESLKGLIE